MLKVDDPNASTQTELEIRLLGVEINQLDNHKKNLKIERMISEARKLNVKKYEQWKQQMPSKIKNSMILNPFMWASMGSGIIASQTLVTGSTLGLLLYYCGSRALANRKVTQNISKDGKQT